MRRPVAAGWLARAAGWLADRSCWLVASGESVSAASKWPVQPEQWQAGPDGADEELERGLCWACCVSSRGLLLPTLVTGPGLGQAAAATGQWLASGQWAECVLSPILRIVWAPSILFSLTWRWPVVTGAPRSFPLARLWNVLGLRAARTSRASQSASQSAARAHCTNGSELSERTSAA